MERTSIDQLAETGQAAGVAAVRSTRQADFGDAVIACDSLVRIYSTAGIEVQALQGLDLLAMTAPAAAAIVLVVVITAAQNALTRRRTKTGVLRLDEGR